MRIISGRLRGMQIKTIDGETTRPTKDMVREALFSILFDKVADSIFLDLFSGSGAIGIEALSRGAEFVYFSDINRECISVINQNLEKARLSDKAEVVLGNYLHVLDVLKDKKFDIVFLDPPYNKGFGVKAIEIISEYEALNKDGIIILETDGIEEVPDSIGIYERYNYKKYGRNLLNFYRRKG